MVAIRVNNNSSHDLSVVGPEHPAKKPLIVPAHTHMTTDYKGHEWTFSYYVKGAFKMPIAICSIKKTLCSGEFTITDKEMFKPHEPNPKLRKCGEWTTIWLNNDYNPLWGPYG